MAALLEIIIQGIFEVICYFTAKILLPVVSFGTVRAEGLQDVGPFKWHGFKQMPDGSIVVQHDTASLLGLLFWVAVVVAVIVYWNWDAL